MKAARNQPPFGGDFRPMNLDLALAAVIALALPPAAAALLDLTGGALASLVLYYAICCVAVVRWRKGTLDYRRPLRWPWGWLLLGVGYVVLLGALNWGHYPPSNAPWLAVILTAIGWGGLNAAMEQLAWIYVLDAWRRRWDTGWQRWAGQVIGWALLLTLVALIHILFWIRFLPDADLGALSWLQIIGNTLLTLLYVRLYDLSRSMWPVFLIHLLTDLQLVLLARYSILPSL